jgi:tRNA(fMet)-specific endonuclease VapC
MVILDTDVLTLVQRGGGEQYECLVAKLEEAGEDACVTIVSFEEQISAYARLHAMLEDFQTRPILDFDADAARQYQRLASMRLRVGTMDMRIAAIALAHGVKLISRNLVDFRKVPGLDVEDWARM